MNITNPGWLRLSELSPKDFTIEKLSPEIKVKIKDTFLYSLKQNPVQDHNECMERCTIATVAEYYVAEHVFGYVNRGGENLKDPHTYAYDVVAHPKFSALRIEVKTSLLNPERMGEKQWVGCTTGQFGRYPGGYGINLGPFIEFSVSDVIIIFRAEKNGPGAFRLTPHILADKYAFSKDAGLVKKSKFTGWYLSERINWGMEDTCSFKLFTTKE